MPDDLRAQIPPIHEVVRLLGWPVLDVPGVEADDVIGTLAKKAEKEGYTTYMVTPDKDFGQLVTENILMYKPGRSGAPPELLGPKEVCARWDLDNTDQVRDIGAQRVQRPNGRCRLALGAGFQPLAQQHQGDHDCRRFKVQMGHGAGRGG